MIDAVMVLIPVLHSISNRNGHVTKQDQIALGLDPSYATGFGLPLLNGVSSMNSVRQENIHIGRITVHGDQLSASILFPEET